ncbi:GSCOCG00007569001-RA-CDS [Cotesia congregata]|uniref:Similar to ZFP36L1: mRNA decay activator protein ZFP36L1 (Homo sapiens) n=1 Tax=Cotesia congregata TaxID=51543 RepID=A0A8J2HMU9_COTCN|nr:GSCOCG00007569001-RA-CDS [Cotesia congregata]CAG5101634.1 Similar to ZFP36L1: mRNA decay activator protein ZFP36L1 (Homo sapiens) [Cotesia congregata]
MSAAVMSTPIYECSEHLFKSGQKSKDPMSVQAGAGPIPLRRSYTSLVTLFEQHRKLDRSVSEPTSRYKTELCRPFEESGTCKYGDKCQFAHGYNELRNLTRHPKYKTELCRTFHTIGFCPYGPRCHFIHNFEEARIHNEKVNQQLGGVQPNIMGLTPFLNVSAAAANLNISLLEQIATAPHQAITAINNIHSPLMRTNSLNIGTQHHTAFTNPPLLRANSLSLMTYHHHNHQTNSVAIGTRPKPLNLSPTFSLGSTAESVSPSSSLSQSPTNSMASFFSDDCAGNPNNNNANLSTTAFSFGQDFGLLAATRQSPSPPGVIVNHHSVSDDLIPRTPSPLSPNNESRLPVFNRISSTIGDFENLKI